MGSLIELLLYMLFTCHFDWCMERRVSKYNHMKCIFPNSMVNTAGVFDFAHGLFALQIHDWLFAKNYLPRPEYGLLVVP